MNIKIEPLKFENEPLYLERVILSNLCSFNGEIKSQILSLFKSDDFIFLSSLFEKLKNIITSQKIENFTDKEFTELQEIEKNTIYLTEPFEPLLFYKQLRKNKFNNNISEGLSKIRLIQDKTKALDEVSKLYQANAYLQNPEPNNIKDLIPIFMENHKNKKTLKGFKTGFDFIDENTKGLCPGHFWILGGYTNVGKTTFMCKLINNLINSDTQPNIFMFSLEMRKLDIVEKIVFDGLFSLKDELKIVEYRKKLENSNLNIFSGINNLSDIITELHSNPIHPDIVLIDYLQLIKDQGKTEYETQTNIAQKLQYEAQNLNSCFFALSQVSNESAKYKTNLIPFKGTGAWGAACDVGLYLYKDQNKLTKTAHDLEGKSNDIGIIYAKIVKNRFGKKEIEKELEFDLNKGFFIT